MQDFDSNTVSDRHGWLCPIEFDPSNTDTVYYAGDFVNKSTDRGQTWTVISPDLGKMDPGRETNPLYADHYGTVTTLGVTKADANTIYAGTDNGFVWLTTDGGTNWSQFVADNLPVRWVTRVAVSQKDPKTAYVAFSGYRQGDNHAYIVRTTDQGKSWVAISNNLPQAPVNDIIRVGNRLYAGTDLGVFVSRANHVKWFRLGKGMPAVPITDIRYVAKNRSLYAGTFGRGIYRIKPPRHF
jgi:photosystem II stability/assembly factor-like uncharacterized protein